MINKLEFLNFVYIEKKFKIFKRKYFIIILTLI